MSYTTRCPACGTTFRVVADQLKISDGWVRCGHCSDVFDATLYLQAWSGGQAQQPPQPQRPQPPDDAAVTEPMPLPDRISDALARALSEPVSADAAPIGAAVSAPPAATHPATPPEPAPEPEPQPEPQPKPKPDTPPDPPPARSTVAQQGVSDDFHAELLQFAAASGVALPAPAGPTEQPAPAPLPQDQGLVTPASPAPAETDSETEPEFVRKARRRAFWRKPMVRVLLSVLLLGLAGVLLAQWSYHERHRLVAWQPRLEPVLRLVCVEPACTIEPLRRIDDIVIDSTALVRRRDDLYSFDIVLKNRADIALAVPALELTLTDMRDQAIARRVFLPQEWPGRPERLPALGELAVSLRLSIELADGMPMAGYRALVFYP
ncbi:MAG: DUF3426 domain-containing protein [Burkholderiales bacterium]|nr:MAG: DUF3426 domain-containing protein [Burkholderiales bacterium]